MVQKRLPGMTVKLRSHFFRRYMVSPKIPGFLEWEPCFKWQGTDEYKHGFTVP